MVKMEFIDLYDHNDPNLIYTPENIPTPDIEEEFNEQFVNGCKCKDSCTKDQCPCVMNCGLYYVFDSEENEVQMEKVHDTYIIKKESGSKPRYECNLQCACYGKICGNKLVQFGPRRHLKIVSCTLDDAVSNNEVKLEELHERTKSTKGFGLITTKSIKQGNFICEYAGEIITREEAIKRHILNEEKRKMNYIFCINEHFGKTSRSTYVDPSKIGNIGRYLNHSCQPNCEIIPIRVNNTIPKICIFAIKDIKQNEELTYDYGRDSTNLESKCSKKQTKCLCLSVQCRKYLPFSEYL